MNRSVFEGRFLVSMLGSIVRQDEKFPVHRRMNWERLFRISDYHNIASAIYLAMLGATERVPEMWGERFFLRYQEAVRYGEAFEAAETEILSTFNAMKLGATVLESSAIRRLYPIAETADNSPLRLYIPEESYTMAKGYLVDLGYETDIFYRGFGEHMKGTTGFRVEIYHDLPFLTKTYQKSMKALMERAYPDKTMTYIKTLSLESSYVFRLAECCYRYCTDELRIREVLDIYLFYKLFRKSMNQKFIDARLKEFNITVTSVSLLHIADMWFGTRKEPLFPAPKNDMAIYDGIESRILSNGADGVDTVPESMKLRKEIYDAQHREERAEKIRKIKAKVKEKLAAFVRGVKFLFPDRKYMGTLYPTVEKFGITIVYFWLLRLLHLLRIEIRVRRELRAERQAEAERADNYYGGDSDAASYGERSFERRERKKVFYKSKNTIVYNADGTITTIPASDAAAEAENPEDNDGTIQDETEGKVVGSIRNSVLSFDSIGEPMDIRNDANFNKEEISEEEAEMEEDEEQELRLWTFPDLSKQSSSFQAESGRENDVVIREHKEVSQDMDFDDRLVTSDDIPRIKFTSYQAVSSSGIVMEEEEEEAPKAKEEAPSVPQEETKTETGTVDGREVEFSKWKFPKIEDVESN